MSLLAPKTIPLFHFTGDKATTPVCPVDMRPNLNPSSGAQSYQRAGADCIRSAKYNLPFFLSNLGPRFSEWSVNAHEARPGHHTQVSLSLPNGFASRVENLGLLATSFGEALRALTLTCDELRSLWSRSNLHASRVASFLPFGHPTQVNASWVTSSSCYSNLLANEIRFRPATCIALSSDWFTGFSV